MPFECSSKLTHLGKRGQLPPSSPVVFSGELREDGHRPEGLVMSGPQRRCCGSIAGGQGLRSPRICPAPPGRGGIHPPSKTELTGSLSEALHNRRAAPGAPASRLCRSLLSTRGPSGAR